MPTPSIFRLVPVLMTVLLIGACLFLAGCSNDAPSRGQGTASLATGSISPPLVQARPPMTTTVRPGDTLHAIARRNNVTAYDLMTSNNLSSARVHAGQTLHVPSY